MYLEEMFQALLQAISDDLAASFPDYDISCFHTECEAHLDKLLFGFAPQRTVFSMPISDMAISQLGSVFEESFSTHQQPDIGYHIQEIRVFIILFGQIVTADPAELNVWLANIQAMFIAYIGNYAIIARLQPIITNYEVVIKEAQLIAMDDRSTVH